MRLAPWGGKNSRTSKLTRAQAEDIIRNCRESSQDAEFAKRYGVSAETVRGIRVGQGWVWLRQEMKGKGQTAQ